MADQNSPHPRVVSLIASSTEILHALGAGDLQVARSHECDYPASVLKLPAVTRPKFDVHGSSAEIDRRVRSLVERGLSVYEVDADALVKLKPDVILTQDQCQVCAVSLADVERAVCEFVHGRPRIVSMRPHTMADIYADIRRIAEAIGRPEAGKKLIASMQERLAAVKAAVVGQPKKRLAFIEWVDPPMSGGHWMPELIDMAGGDSVFGTTGEPSPWITWKDVSVAAPDVILVAPCGYDIETTRREVRPLARYALWQELRAVRDGNVFLADGNAYFNRPGPRLVESTQILAEIMHPDVCDFGLRGKAYIDHRMISAGAITNAS
ncbi:MAG: cobalamin-binding protein [Hyphomicrobium sp.]|uniref:cobalamin-binding protein n=1 Tax=Hyphomicrobium sp. TaxID=82 RepID=UPI001324F025|nr:cobalamin-binding protein [Hyphomicrobium sp.]KAB2940389.1 MAG: cobalamin-binding protein [Hyphomicrobium sp.]MBZ0209117.1 cobalamin-binding protein [Hyphomicrobium sp.]